MRDHQARVKVSDDVWSEFRETTRNSSVAIALGDLVTREVDRYRARRVREGSADEQELLEALERAQELHAELAELVRRLERRIELRAARLRGLGSDVRPRTSRGRDSGRRNLVAGRRHKAPPRDWHRRGHGPRRGTLHERAGRYPVP